jgi:hypothetical protein
MRLFVDSRTHSDAETDKGCVEILVGVHAGETGKVIEPAPGRDGYIVVDLEGAGGAVEEHKTNVQPVKTPNGRFADGDDEDLRRMELCDLAYCVSNCTEFGEGLRESLRGVMKARDDSAHHVSVGKMSEEIARQHYLAIREMLVVVESHETNGK